MLDKAEELGRAIGQTEEYRALKRAQDGMESKGEFAGRIEKLQALAAGLEEHAARGATPPADAAAEYDRLFGEVQADPLYQALVAAQANFDKLMVRIHERMAEGMRHGGESRIITLG